MCNTKMDLVCLSGVRKCFQLSGAIRNRWFGSCIEFRGWRLSVWNSVLCEQWLPSVFHHTFVSEEADIVKICQTYSLETATHVHPKGNIKVESKIINITLMSSPKHQYKIYKKDITLVLIFLHILKIRLHFWLN